MTRDNHFVPQWYLKQWAVGSAGVWTYRLLVSHPRVSAWEQRQPRGIAFQSDLYTSVSGDSESDEFEQWILHEFEEPAQAALKRVLNDEPLLPHHWQHLGRYALCQQLRSPQDLIESLQRWEETLPDLMENTLHRAVAMIEECHAKGEPLPEPRGEGGYGAHLKGAVKVIVRPNARPETDEGEVGVTMLLGRDLWLRQQRHLLEGVGRKAALHSWSIAQPADGSVWFTSDQPVARVNYTDNGFDLKGGWGRPQGNIFMPLSPQHLLLTQIGEQLPPRLQLAGYETAIVTRALAQRAHRVFFADRRLRSLEQLRPRIVDAAAFQSEAGMWARWHDEQSAAQRKHEAG